MAATTVRQRIGIGLALTFVLGAASGCGTGGSSPFASAPPTTKQFIAAAVTWDLNKNGDVTCEEWRAYVGGLFQEADANHDGTLTREEFAVMAQRDRLFETARFNYFDTGGDSRLTLAEIADKPNPAFRLLDKNGDCRLTPEERAGRSAQFHGRANSHG
jgi:EF hand